MENSETNDIAKIWQQAVNAHKSGHLNEAKKLYTKVVDIIPDEFNSWHMLGLVSFQQGDLPTALSLIEKSLSLNPNQPQAHGNLGTVQRALSQLDEAAISYQKALELDPTYLDASYNLALVHKDQGFWKEALAAFETVLQVNPGHANSYYNRAEAWLSLGQTDHAIADYQKVIELQPENLGARINLASQYLAQGKLDDAEKQLDQVLETQPQHVEALNNKGVLWQQRHESEKSVQVLEQALTHQPHNIGVLCNLGQSYHNAGHLNKAIQTFRQVLCLKREQKVDPPELTQSFSKTSESKLKHDLEQLRYLIEKGILPAEAENWVSSYEAVLQELKPQFQKSHLVPFTESQQALLTNTYNRPYALHKGEAFSESVINPELDTEAIQNDYFNRAPGITYFDNVLTPAALNRLRDFCLESAVWYECHYGNGYLGAMMNDGFFCPLLAQITDELPRAFPKIFKHHKLAQLWAYKYDSEMLGIRAHADFAAVNINFWITPDDANLNPESGGLVLWDKEAPDDWTFETYNQNRTAIEEFIQTSGANKIVVPHRQNRFVMFNSDLIHKTDDLHFKPGYENRRINITMLYGYRESD